MSNEENGKLESLNKEIKEKLFQVKNSSKEENDTTGIIDEIWELSKKIFVLKANSDKSLKRYKGIIFTVGFSAEPIILNIIALKPECVYFIYTRESERVLDLIFKETNIKPTQYKRELMPRDSAADSYNLVKKGLKFLMEEKGLSKEKIALDPTGGTKIMSVGCGIAASIFNTDIIYVNNKKYNPELRRPEPGSELLVNIPNPFDIYQDDKLIEGFNYLRNFNFINAKEIFNYIKNYSTKPLFPEFLASLADILYSWDMIDYSNAIKSINKSREFIPKLKNKLSKIQVDLIRILNSWEKYLKTINTQIEKEKLEVEKISPLLIYDILKNANRDFYSSNYNSAALKYYRTIEMINQYILFNEYNFNTQTPNYSNISENIKNNLLKLEENNDFDIESIVLNRYNEIWKKIDEKTSTDKEFRNRTLLPRKMGLLAGIIVRNIFGDKNVNFDMIFKIYQAVEKRNQSIFAHGIVSINKKECEKLKNIAEKMMESVIINQGQEYQVFNRNSIAHLIDLFKNVI